MENNMNKRQLDFFRKEEKKAKARNKKLQKVIEKHGVTIENIESGKFLWHRKKKATLLYKLVDKI